MQFEYLEEKCRVVSISFADDGEIDDVVDSIQERCANIKRVEHIGIHSVDFKCQIEGKSFPFVL